LKNETLKLVEKFEIPIVEDIFSYPFVIKKTKKIPYHFAQKHVVLPLEEDEESVLVASQDPFDLPTVEELRWLLEKKVKIIYCPKEILQTAIENCYQVTEDETHVLFTSSEESKTQIVSSEESIEGYDLLERSQKNPVIGILNAIIVEAIQQNASDIHFEPQEKDLLIRYRIDGVLLTRRSPPREYQMNIVTRLKVMAKLDIAEKRLPQDGRMKLKMGKREIDFRVSTIPIAYGERIVLRILDKMNVLLGIDKLGMGEEILSPFKKMIRLPEGIVLVTGPTGSGKTTTLYSVISEIHSSQINIMTIEDPVEYKLQNIAQIGVNPKINLTFAKGLRHILRQDPDVIMIGEIRDRETAEIAIQSSLTGHMVFSTLHTNDAPSAITRLVDMGIEPYLLSSSIVGVMAQRLVRCICENCKTSYIPAEEELKQLGLSSNDLENGYLFKGKGCDECFHTGYVGRHGIYELLKITPKMRHQMSRSVEAEKLRKIAKEQSYKDLFASGVNLVKRGITSSCEVLRVTSNLQEGDQ